MPDDMMVPCRDWLALEPGDLAFPHRVVGVAEDERDPLAIVRAADRRFAVLRTVPPERAAERDALTAQVEAARDALLAVAARATPPAQPPVPSTHRENPMPTHPAPPPVPAAAGPAPAPPPPPIPFPVVPPPVPPAIAADASETVAPESVRFTPRPRRRHRGGDGGATALGVAALAMAVAALAFYLAWPHLQTGPLVSRANRKAPLDAPAGGRATAQRPEPTTTRKTQPRPEGRPATPPVQEREPQQPAPVHPESEPRRAPPSADPDDDPRSTPATTATTAVMSAAPAPATAPPPPPPPTPPPPPPVDVERVRSLVGAAIAEAYAAIRDGDFEDAQRKLNSVADTALDDQEATDRLQRWKQFATYATAYPRYRDKALASAAATTATYDMGGRKIAVVEFTAGEFIYRDSRRPGQNQRVARDAIPPDIERVLVEQWFANDGRAANHLFLGAAALSGRSPDPARARRAWEAAAEGNEPDGRLLLRLLDDPIIGDR